MNVKRALALVLTLLLCLAAVSAFGAAEDPKSKPAVYTMMVAQDPLEGDWKDMWVFEEIERQTGITFEFTEVSTEAFEEKKNIAFATNTLPDVFLSGLTETDIVTYGSQGILWDLAPFINEQYTPVIAEIFEKYPIGKKALTYPNGAIYNLRGFNANDVTREKVQSRFFVNAVWLNNLGLAEPTTLSEFYDVLLAVKEGDADLDGDPDNEIPLGGRYNNHANSSGLARVFLNALGHLTNDIEVLDGVVQCVPATEEYRLYLEYMHKLYAEGLLDSEFFTQTADQFNAKLTAGSTFAFVDAAHWYHIPDQAMWSQYDGIEPMTSDVNDVKMWSSTDITFIGHFVVTSNLSAGDVQNVLRVPNFTYSLMGRVALTVPGVPKGTFADYPEWGYEYIPPETPDAEYVLTVTAPEGYETYNAFRHIFVHPTWGKLPTLEVREYLSPWPPFYTEQPESQLTRVILQHYQPYQQNGWPTIKMTSEESDEISMIATDLTPYLEEMESKIIIGDLSIDAFDEMVAGMKARGMERLVEIYKGAYERYMAS